MRALIQRVSRASVTVGDETVATIGKGLLVLAAVAPGDCDTDLAWIAGKIARMRLFPDSGGGMNLDLAAVGGEILAVSQFTLFASTKKGNRPSWQGAAPPDIARPLFDRFVVALEREAGRGVATGRFGADMRLDLCNDGPVTIWLDSRAKE